MNSKAFSINMADLLAVGKNAALVSVAAGLTYVGQHLTSVDLGPSAVLVVPIASLVIDSVVKWAKDNTK